MFWRTVKIGLLSDSVQKCNGYRYKIFFKRYLVNFSEFRIIQN